MSRILLIDDDPELGELLSTYLEGEGFSLESRYTANDGLAAFNENSFDLIILDIMLPDMSGLSVLGKIRAVSPVPVVMLTGRGEEVDRVVGLEMGADDYVSKPFPLRELLARMRAVLRRYTPAMPADVAESTARGVIDLEALQVDLDARNVVLEGKPVHVTAAEFSILEMLVGSRGKIVERDDLMERALGRSPDFDDYVLNVHMSNLRKKIGSAVSIKTIRGRGYILAIPNGL